MTSAELIWEPPGPGPWYADGEHLPTPMTTLGGELLLIAAAGFAEAAARYGLPPDGATFGGSNRWFFFSPGPPVVPDLEALERVAAETLATERWRGDLRRWEEQLRPTVVAENRALVAEDLAPMTDAELADHVERALAHFARRAPLHFAETMVGDAPAGALCEAAVAWGLDRRALVQALAGAATATASAEALFDRMAAGLPAGDGLDGPTDLDALRQALRGDAGAALEELLTDYAWRAFFSDLAEPTLAERPDAIWAGILAAQAGRSPRHRPDPDGLAALRDQVPAEDRERFDDLAAAARAAYGANDDNSTVLFSLPLGLVRRAMLEVGRRLVAAGRLRDVDDALEALPAELPALLAGGGPVAATLAARADERHRMASVTPPPMIGAPFPSAPPVPLPPSVQRLDDMIGAYRSIAWAGPDDSGRAAASVGTTVVRGRAVVTTDPADALVRMEPGDVLVTLTTTAVYNTIFPAAAAVAVEHGSLVSHAAVLARELGLTAVIGVPGLLDRVHDGDQVEVDPLAGTITVITPAR